MYHIDTLTSLITHIVGYGHDYYWYYDHYHLLYVSISFYACNIYIDKCYLVMLRIWQDSWRTSGMPGAAMFLVVTKSNTFVTHVPRRI